MAEENDIRDMAKRFFDAIEAGDIETMQDSFTPDAEIWHNTDELIVTPAQTAQTLTGMRSEEHTSELQSLMRISYAVFCLKKKNNEHHTAIKRNNTCTRISHKKITVQ